MTVVTHPAGATRWWRPFLLVAALHVLAAAGLAIGAAQTPATGVLLAAAAFAYSRGLIHAADFDHISVIDNSIRKFVAEGRRPTTVGLAFSAGHSTVVMITGLLVASGSSIAATLLDGTSTAATALGVIGLTVSGLYLLLLALNNTTFFASAWRARRQLKINPQAEIPTAALYPTGPAARLLARPLARVRRPRHIYLVGFLFGLGFDTASTIGLLMTTATAAATGANPIALLSLPLLFTAAMTLGDTINNLVMLRIYSNATATRSRITYNLIVTGIGVGAALTVAVLAAAALLDQAGTTASVVTWLAALDPSYLGYALITAFLITATAMWVRSRHTTEVSR